MKPIKTSRTRNPYRRTARPVVLRVSEIERLALEQLAVRYAGGNLSAFVRHAALSFKGKM